MTSESTISSRSTPPAFSPGRIWALATNTLTQLVRMKTFYLLLLFLLVPVGIANLDLDLTAAQKLRKLAEVSIGVMDTFAWVFAIAATAILIPSDLEDRTLYTILAKPVSRLEYLLGKLGGVFLTIGLVLLGMMLILFPILWFREAQIVAQEMPRIADWGSAEAQAAYLAEITQFGVRPELLYATWAIFLKAIAIASVTMFLSTFATSSLFTILAGLAIYLIGHAHTMAVNFWMEAGGGQITQILGKLVRFVIPDFTTFAVVNRIVEGQAVTMGALVPLTILAGAYFVFYTLVSLYFLIDREF